MTATDLETAEEARSRARKSSFYRAMAILPREKRDAMFEIYSFCRAVDDIADEGGDREAKCAGLESWRRAIDALYAGERRASPPDLPSRCNVSASSARTSTL